jgi:hypothetical protein
MTTSLPTAESFFSSSAASAKFAYPGDTITGRITVVPQVQQQKDFTTGESKFWPDGKPMVQLQVTLATDQRDPDLADDDGTRSVYVKGKMQMAVGEAVRKSGAKYLEPGGLLTITYTGDGEQKQRGMNPPKLYSAVYAPPTVQAAAAFLGTQPAAAATAAAPASPAAQFTPEQLAAMKAAGIDTSKLAG